MKTPSTSTSSATAVSISRPHLHVLRAGLVLTGLLLSSIPCQSETGYIWPLTIKPALASTFGETRSTAFHAGIDVKTWGKTGYPVRAIADGHIMRVRTSPWGYGRAVYQRLADDRIAVYGHLESFAPPLDERVWAAQVHEGQYSVDLWMEADEIAVRQGQVIAHTGQSGAGPPHLHLELRSSDNVPINPLTVGYSVEDATAPTIRRLGLVPVGLESTVEGGHEPYTMSLRWRPQTRRFENGGLVSVCGRIGVSVLSHDRAEAAPNKLAPYRHVLLVDGRVAVTSTYGQVAYSDAYQVALDRMRAGTGSNDSYFTLYRSPGNRLGFYKVVDGGDGFLLCGPQALSDTPPGSPLVLSPGPHELEVVAADFAGNESRARIRIQVNDLERVTADQLEGESFELVSEGGMSDPDHGQRRPLRLVLETTAYEEFVEVRIRASQVLAKAPAVRLSPAEPEDGRDDGLWGLKGWWRRRRSAPMPVTWVKPRHVGLGDYVATVPLIRVGGEEEVSAPPDNGGPIAGSIQVDVGATAVDGATATAWTQLARQRVVPAQEARLSFGDGEAMLEFAAGSAYAPLYPQGVAFRPQATDELQPASTGYAFGPGGVSFDRRVTVSFRAQSAPVEKLGVYADDGDGGWVFLGNEPSADSTRVEAKVRGLGRMALFIDGVPPVIGSVSPRGGSVVSQRRPWFRAEVDDGGAGIGREEDVVMELNGQRLISVYDPEAKVVEYWPRRDLAVGLYELVVRVRDRCGNEGVRRVVFRVE